MSTLRLEKSLEEIRSELYAHMENVQDDYAAKGWLPQRLNLNKGIARGLTELFAWGLWQLYQVLAQVHKQAIPLSASGDWLNIHAEQIGLTRKVATKAVGLVVFTRSDSDADTKSNIRIPAGRIVRTQTDGTGSVYRYVTLEDAVLSSENDTVNVRVEAEEYGAKANAAAGQIVELATPVVGIASVSNVSGWLTEEGAGAESDASLQARYTLAWKAQAGITSAAYEAAALAVTGVAGVYIDDQHPRGEGTVDIIVQGTAGIPTTQLLDDVESAIEGVIRINHDVLVKAPSAVDITISFDIEMLSGDTEATKKAATDWICSLFSNASGESAFGIGVDIVRDRLALGIIGLSGVKRIVWASPLADVTIASDELAVLDSLTVTTSWAESA